MTSGYEQRVIDYLHDHWPFEASDQLAAARRGLDVFKQKYPDFWDAYTKHLTPEVTGDVMITIILDNRGLYRRASASRQTYDFRVVLARKKENLLTLVFQLAKQEFGSPGRRWGERDTQNNNTYNLYFADDNGVLPGRGRGRFTTIPQLLSQFRKDMPQGLPNVLKKIDSLFGSGEYSLEPKQRKISFAWKGRSGENEEWSVEIPQIAEREPKQVDADPEQLRAWAIKAVKRVGDGVRSMKAGSGVKYSLNEEIRQDSRSIHAGFSFRVENPSGDADNYRPGIFFYWDLDNGLGSVRGSGMFMASKVVEGLEWDEMEGAMLEVADAIIKDLKHLMGR